MRIRRSQVVSEGEALREAAARWRKSAQLLACVLPFCALVAACGSQSSSSSSSAGATSGATNAASTSKAPIVVGAAVASSGLASPFDQPPLDAFKIAIKDINAAGGIAGRKLELLQEDTQSSINGTPAVAQDLIQRGAQIMLVTCDYDFGAPAANVAQKHGLVSFSLCATSPKFGVQGVGADAYTPAASVGDEAAVAATWAISKGWKRADLMLDTSLSYTRGLCSAFTKFYKQLGGSIVGQQSVSQTGVATSSQINPLSSSNAQVVLLCSYPPGGGSLVRAIRAAGVKLPLLAGNPFDGAFWVNAAPGVSDFYTVSDASTFGDDPNPTVNTLVGKYVKQYGQPSTTQMVMGYAIAQMLREAIPKAGGTSGTALSGALNQLNNFSTVGGPVTYTSTVHIPLDRPLEILQFANGKPKYLTTVTPKVKVGLADGAS